VTQTGLRAGLHVTQPLVVTLRPAVTHVVRVKTDLRVETAVVTRTLKAVAVQVVLVVQAVKVAVTARVHRQAQAGLTDTAVVGLWTRIIHHPLRLIVAVAVKLNDDKNERGVGKEVIVPLAAFLI
jgi:hypothetical protein